MKPTRINLDVARLDKAYEDLMDYVYLNLHEHRTLIHGPGLTDEQKATDADLGAQANLHNKSGK